MYKYPIIAFEGIEGSGKSYMAAQIAANAQQKDIDVVYFDAESAIDPDLLWDAVVLSISCIAFR